MGGSRGKQRFLVHGTVALKRGKEEGIMSDKLLIVSFKLFFPRFHESLVDHENFIP